MKELQKTVSTFRENTMKKINELCTAKSQICDNKTKYRCSQSFATNNIYMTEKEDDGS